MWICLGCREDQSLAAHAAIFGCRPVPVQHCNDMSEFVSRSKALSSLSVESPRRAPHGSREREVLRVSGVIHGGPGQVTAGEVRTECLRWVVNRTGGSLPEGAWRGEPFELFRGGRNAIAVHVTQERHDLWCVRTDDPDKTVPGRTWSTETVVAMLAADAVAYGLRLLMTTTEAEPDIEPHVPGQVRQVADRFPLMRRNQVLASSPQSVISDDDVVRLVRLLEDSSRELPVIVVSANEAGETYADAHELARSVVGTAGVATIGESASWSLTERVGKRHSVFGGAVRVYLPGFSRAANPFAHRLFLPDAIADAAGRREAVRWLRTQAAESSLRQTRLGEHLFTFSQIRNLYLQIRRHEAAQLDFDVSEQLSLAEQQILTLERQVEEQSEMLDYFALQADQERERADAAEEIANASAFRIQNLLGQMQKTGAPVADQAPLPRQWEDFADWCSTALAGRVVLADQARRNVRSPEFQDVQLAARVLVWLANVLVPRRLDGGGPLTNAVVEPGIINAPCGADTFTFDWRGRRYEADWHIKNGGNTRDPSRCIRVYYAWDPATNQVVVADMPAHRRTGAT